MSIIDNEKLISWPKTVMIVGGFWKRPFTNNNLLKGIFQYYCTFMQASYMVFYCSLVLELIREIVSNYELSIIVVNFGVVVNASKIFIKLVIYLKNNVLELFDDVVENEKKVWQSDDDEIKTLYRKNIVALKIFSVLLCGSTFAAVMVFQISGTFGTLQIIEYNREHNTTMESHYMYETIFPTNKLQHLNWLFASQTLWTWVAITYNNITHLISATLLVYAATQLQILQIRFRKFVEHNIQTKEEIEEKIDVLKGLVAEHQYIIGFVEHFNNCTKYIIKMEFLLSSFDMASFSANLIKSNWSDMGMLLFVLFLLCVQLFLLAWTCNEIQVQSEAVANGLFESKWYLLNKEAAQMVQLIIARAQKPLVMTIGPFGPMTMRSAFLIIKAAYSYVSIMRE